MEIERTPRDPVPLEDTSPSPTSHVEIGGVVATTDAQQVALASLTSLSLPRLQKFAGDKLDDDDVVDQFLREFERHSLLAGWRGTVKKVQFEFHLSGRALRVYEAIPDHERTDFETASKAFKRELQPVLLGSYRHTVFHNHKQREGEPVAEFAHDVQRLFEKAYSGHRLSPELRDQILLGHFEQGLLRRWKERLRHPLATFEEELTQAKLAEAAEKQLLTEQLPGTMDWLTSPSPGSKGPRQPSNKFNVQCFVCQERGHMSFQCPNVSETSQPQPAGNRKKADVECFYCHCRGHYLSDCPQLAQKRTGDRSSRVALMETVDQRLGRLRQERDRVSRELAELEQLRLLEKLTGEDGRHVFVITAITSHIRRGKHN